MLRLGLAIVATLSAQTGYDEAYLEARNLVQEGRVEEALAKARALLASASDRPEGYFLLGDVYRRLWRPREAIETFSRALSETEGDPVELHREMAVTYAELRAWESALEEVDRALAISAEHPRSLYTKAMVLTQKGARSEALRLYQSLLASEPENASLYFRIGELQESMTRMVEAEEAYRRAIELDPGLQGARYRLGKLLFETGRTQQAERQLARAVTASPGHAESHLELALALDALGRNAKARHHFEKALELDPWLATAYLSYGNYAVRQGDRERGLALLARFEELSALERRSADLLAAVDYTPEDFEAKEQLVSFLIEHEQFPLALRTMQRIQLTDMDDENNYALIARIYEEWGRDEDARRTLEAKR